jgi:PST family polysaccharide transporter
MTGRLIATLLIFLFVREPGDGWMVLGFHALAASILSAGGCALVLREVTPARPSLRLVGQTLRLGFTMFLMRLAVMVNTAGNAFLLGLLVAPQHVAFFVAGEKLCRTSSWLLQPINIVLLPRIAHLLGERPEQARRLASLGLVAMAGIGLSFAVAIGIAAPVIVDVLFGERYAAAVPVTRVMALIVPLIVVNTCLVSYWLVPRGLDRGLNLVLISAAILNVGLVLLVAPLFQALGVAWVTFAVEGFILMGFLVILRRRGLRPLDAGILRDLAARVLGRGRAVSAD